MTAKALHHCPKCGVPLIGARISRYVNERWVSSLWCCEACGHEHETFAAFSEKPNTWSGEKDHFYIT